MLNVWIAVPTSPHGGIPAEDHHKERRSHLPYAYTEVETLVRELLSAFETDQMVSVLP